VVFLTSYLIIASLAGSADAQNVDPDILKEICKGLKDENPYCVHLRFLGVEARSRAEGITVIPRMVDQVQHFDVCSVVNNRQTGAMTLQVRTHTNNRNTTIRVRAGTKNSRPVGFLL
jgi:hypothetical protein